jgi:hypothetical protein
MAIKGKRGNHPLVWTIRDWPQLTRKYRELTDENKPPKGGDAKGAFLAWALPILEQAANEQIDITPKQQHVSSEAEKNLKKWL